MKCVSVLGEVGGRHGILEIKMAPLIPAATSKNLTLEKKFTTFQKLQPV